MCLNQQESSRRQGAYASPWFLLQEMLKSLKEGDTRLTNQIVSRIFAVGASCSICIEQFEQPMVTPCGHQFCKECILGWLSSKNTCPMCRKNITTNQLQSKSQVERSLQEQRKESKKRTREQAEQTEGPKTIYDFISNSDKISLKNSKIEALMEELISSTKSNKALKSVIFSQFTM